MSPLYKTFSPHNALQPFVAQYLYARKDFELGNTIPIIPTGLPALLLFLEPKQGGNIKYYQPFQKRLNFNEFYLFGQTTESYWLEMQGEFSSFIIVLYPTALNYILGQSAAVLTNNIIPLNEIGIDTSRVIEQLLTSNNLLHQLPVLDAFLIKLFNHRNRQVHDVRRSLDLILRSHGQVSIDELHKQERVSTRTLQRKFTECIGLPPKAYLRLIRFRSMMQFATTHPNVSWLDLTYQFGYYDQSHLIKDFKQYTGQPPQLFFQADQKVDSAILSNI